MKAFAEAITFFWSCPQLGSPVKGACSSFLQLSKNLASFPHNSRDNHCNIPAGPDARRGEELPGPSPTCHQSQSAVEGFKAFHANDLYGILDSSSNPLQEPDPGLWSPLGPPSRQEPVSNPAAGPEASALAAVLRCASSSEATLADVEQAKAADASWKEMQPMDEDVCQHDQGKASRAEEAHSVTPAQQRLQAGTISGETG